MKKRIYRNLASIVLFTAICLTSTPLTGYGAELNQTDISVEEEPANENLTDKTLTNENSTDENLMDENLMDENLTHEVVPKPVEETEPLQDQELFSDGYFYYVDDNGNRYPIYTDGDYSFISKDDKTAMITAYNGTNKNVTVPETLSAEDKTYTVTTIGYLAFYNQEFKSITLPETTKKLEEYAFYCTCSGHIYLPKSIKSIEGKQMRALYWCWKDSYAHKYLKKNNHTQENVDFFCVDNPPTPALYSQKTGVTNVTLAWKKIPGVTGYKIVSCDKNGKKQKKAAILPDNKKTSCQIKGLKSNKVYYFQICSQNTFQGKTYNSDYSSVISLCTKPSAKSVSSVNKKIKNGYSAKITKKRIVLPASVFTTYDSATMHYTKSSVSGLLAPCTHGDWAILSEITNFWDHKGQPNIVCSDGKTVYITRYKTNFKKRSMLKIKKKYPLLGDVVCDKKGNYYIVWGKEDTSGKGNRVTMAVSKYTYSGKHVKTVTYKTSSKSSTNSMQTREPFGGGECANCSTVITDGVLVCLYGRGMYNGHQSSDVIAVNTEKMTKNTDYSTYTSHSFDQRVIALKDGGVCYADHGDAYPRGFNITFSKTNKYTNMTPFHFYGEIGANTTNAWLGGICETDMGIMLSGASQKALKAGNGGKNLFIQLVDSKRKIAGSKNRKGKSGGQSYTDKGVKWLTNYPSAYDVANPKLVKTDDEKIVVLWEKFKNSVFVESYYMILAGDGSILQKATPMQKTRLASFEEPLYKKGKIYWITAGKIVQGYQNGYFGYVMTDGKNAVVNCLEVGKLVKKCKR